MSANAVLAPHGHYKDQLKLMRAGIAAEWAIDSIRWLSDAIRQLPSADLEPREAPPLSRYSSYFY